jgi:AcrR family transcriptional regulator
LSIAIDSLVDKLARGDDVPVTSARQGKQPAGRPRRSARRARTRVRRTAEEARTAILDAAERRLVTSGPAGIRLQEVADDVGVSHPTVLHHFGSRDELVREVCERRYAAIRADLVAAMASSAGGVEHLSDMIEAVAAAVRAHGHARAVFWLALEGQLRDDRPRLLDLGVAAHELRTRKRRGRTAPVEDTLHVLALSTLALLAEAVVGPNILADLGLGGTPQAGARFRAWLARLLADHLEFGPR